MKPHEIMINKIKLRFSSELLIIYFGANCWEQISIVSFLLLILVVYCMTMVLVYYVKDIRVWGFLILYLVRCQRWPVIISVLLRLIHSIQQLFLSKLVDKMALYCKLIIDCPILIVYLLPHSIILIDADLGSWWTDCRYILIIYR